MCELLAVNAAQPVVVNAYLEEFFTHSHVHKDGWGISWRLGEGCSEVPAGESAREGLFIHREAVPAWTSSYIPELLSTPVKARLLEAHIRRTTGSSVCLENCHPFVGSDISGNVWTMIHNGVLLNEGLTSAYDLRAAGETDSERVMLFFLDVLEEASLRAGGDLDFDGRFNALASVISQISNLNRLNLILDDGTYTYVHTNTSEDTLHYLELEDGIIFSTQPLGDDETRALWKPVPRNRLIAYRDGRLVRTSVPHGYVFCEAIVDLYHAFGEDWVDVLD